MSVSEDLKLRLNKAATEEQSEYAMALLVSEVIDPDLDVQAVQQRFEKLVAPLTQIQSLDTQGLLDFFRRAGFGGPPLERVDLSHSNLQWVLTQHQGLPIAVAAILIEAARRFGLVAHGINYPGHFLLSVQGEIVDPLSLSIVQRHEFAQKLSDAEIDELMQPTQTRVFGLRMLNNVKIQYSQAEHWSEILDIIECQLLVETVDQQAQAVLQFERGECLQKMSLPDQARRAYMTCLALSPPAQIMLQAEQRLRDLKQPADRTLH